MYGPYLNLDMNKQTASPPKKEKYKKSGTIREI